MGILASQAGRTVPLMGKGGLISKKRKSYELKGGGGGLRSNFLFKTNVFLLRSYVILGYLECSKSMFIVDSQISTSDSINLWNDGVNFAQKQRWCRNSHRVLCSIIHSDVFSLSEMLWSHSLSAWIGVG